MICTNDPNCLKQQKMACLLEHREPQSVGHPETLRTDESKQTHKPRVAPVRMQRSGSDKGKAVPSMARHRPWHHSWEAAHFISPKGCSFKRSCLSGSQTYCIQITSQIKGLSTPSTRFINKHTQLPLTERLWHAIRTRETRKRLHRTRTNPPHPQTTEIKMNNLGQK